MPAGSHTLAPTETLARRLCRCPLLGCAAHMHGAGTCIGMVAPAYKNTLDGCCLQVMVIHGGVSPEADLEDVALWACS